MSTQQTTSKSVETIGSFPANGVITKLVKDNPRRKGTNRYKRFACYRTGMTVSAAIKNKVVTPSGLLTDTRDKLIKIGKAH